MSEITADKLVKAHLKIRDAISKLAKEYEAARAVLETQKDEIDHALISMLKEAGAESIKTAQGTAYTTVKPQYSTTDWDSMYAFMKEHDCLYLLQQRLAQKNMHTFLQDNPDLIPAGLSSSNKLTVTVRRATAKE